MSDELYIEGQRIPLPEETVIALTYRANDIGDPGKINGSLSNTFSAPLTQQVREILESAEQVNSDTDIPYRQLSARVVREGSDVKGFENAKAILEVVPDKITADFTVYGGNREFTAELDGKSIRDLDLSDLDHIYDLTTIVTLNGNYTDGINYPVIDFSSDDSAYSNVNRDVDMRKLMPCLWYHTLLERIFDSIGWTMEGDILTDARFLGTAINTVSKLSGDPTRLLAKAKLPNDYVVSLNGSGPFTSALELPISQDIYDPLDVIRSVSSVIRYVAQGPGDYSFKFTCKAAFLTGSSLSVVLVSSTGGTLDTDTLSTNILGDLEVSYTGLTMATGDTVWIRIDGNPDASFDLQYSILEDCLFQCTNVNLDQVAVGTTFPIACNLPDIKQIDIIKAFMWEFFLTPVPDNVNKIIRFVRFEKVKENIPNAPDMSRYIDASAFNLRHRMNAFAQENWMRYKPDDNVTVEYGDGVLIVGDATLERKKTLYTLPFAASEDVTTLTNLEVLNIGLFDTTGKFISGVQSRIFQIVSKSVTGPGITFTDGSGTSTQTTVGMAYFNRPGEDYNMDFQGSLIPTYGATWSQMIYRPKIATLLAKLTHDFMQQFEHDVPWFINVSDGYVTINGYFYVNSINNYIPGKTAPCELILLPNG